MADLYWLYLPEGTVSHAVSRDDGMAICNVNHYLYNRWHGGDGKDETTECRRLPHCRNCVRVLEDRQLVAKDVYHGPTADDRLRAIRRVVADVRMLPDSGQHEATCHRRHLDCLAGRIRAIAEGAW